MKLLDWAINKLAGWNYALERRNAKKAGSVRVNQDLLKKNRERYEAQREEMSRCTCGFNGVDPRCPLHGHMTRS